MMSRHIPEIPGEPAGRLVPRRLLVRLHEDLQRINLYHGFPDFPFPPVAYRVIIFAEDRRFHRHCGVDFRAVLRELLRYASFGHAYGASTIDMQFVRTCLNRRERSAARKITEAILAIIINFRYSKIEILSDYMRFAYFGHGVTGLDEAIANLYGTNPTIGLEEAAFLAACLVFPIPSDKNIRWKERVDKRRDLILKRIRAHKKEFDEIPGIKIIY
jgi:membrane peptidoglycan carboxypeptidase